MPDTDVVFPSVSDVNVALSVGGADVIFLSLMPMLMFLSLILCCCRYDATRLLSTSFIKGANASKLVEFVRTIPDLGSTSGDVAVLGETPTVTAGSSTGLADPYAACVVVLCSWPAPSVVAWCFHAVRALLTASQHTLSQPRLQQYTAITEYVSSNLPSHHCPVLPKSRTVQAVAQTHTQGLLVAWLRTTGHAHDLYGCMHCCNACVQ